MAATSTIRCRKALQSIVPYLNVFLSVAQDSVTSHAKREAGGSNPLAAATSCRVAQLVERLRYRVRLFPDNPI